MVKILVIGLGIGSLYADVCRGLGFIVDTVDINPEKHSTYNAIPMIPEIYDMAIICTPNNTHERITYDVLPTLKTNGVVLVEKPGYSDPIAFKRVSAKVLSDNKKIRMVKNNQYRPYIKEIQLKIKELMDLNKLTHVHVDWLNHNRVPAAGTWFTDKQKAFGGVSRDLLPHALSTLNSIMNESTFFEDYNYYASGKAQRYTLAQVLGGTAWGIENPNGKYNVDDYAWAVFDHKGVSCSANVSWKNNTGRDNNKIVLSTTEGTIEYDFGFCPTECYKLMILDHLNTTNPFADDLHYKEDLYIHEIVHTLRDVSDIKDIKE